MGYQSAQEAVEPEFQCPICLNVLEDIVMAPECHHMFCRGCITEWLSHTRRGQGGHCPCDRTPLTMGQLIAPQRPILSQHSRLVVCCPYRAQGCPRYLRVGEVADHVTAVCCHSPRRSHRRNIGVPPQRFGAESEVKGRA